MYTKTLLLVIVFIGFLFLVLTGTSRQSAKVNKTQNIYSGDSVKLLTDPPHFYFNHETFLDKLNDIKNTIAKNKTKRKKEQKEEQIKLKKEKYQKNYKKMKQKRHEENKKKNNNKKHQLRTINNVLLTAYTARCPGCSGKTYLDFDVKNTIYHHGKRVIAVDPTIIKLYSLVKIIFPSGKRIIAIAGDTGGKINDAHIDLLVKTKSKALNIGKKHVKIKILRSGK